jgi:FlaA1/EpsC-like NDP-sugar epimerase
MQSPSLGHATRKNFQRSLAARISMPHFWKWDLKRRRPAVVLVAEIFLAACSYALALCLLADGRSGSWVWNVLRATLPWLIAARLLASLIARLYRRSLHYASMLDLISVTKAISASSILLWLFVRVSFPYLRIPSAVFLVDWAFLHLFWGSLHFGNRIFTTRQSANRKTGRRVVIVGAGDAGMRILKELALDSSSPCRPVAIVDDDKTKWGRTRYEVPIMGGIATLARTVASTNAEEIFVCIPSATQFQTRSILDACRKASVPVRTLPSLAELVDRERAEKVSSRDLRSPRIEDLLQREDIRVDLAETRGAVSGKVVLVTGAGGSIGSELCRQIANANPRKLLLLDKSENSLFYVDFAIREKLESARVKPFLMDLLSADRLKEMLRAERPDIIFHAAAYKHVGLLELHPQEAIRNNVLGTRNLAEAAIASGVRHFVNISTDKAVNPRSYMGLSKTLTELCVQALGSAQTTRFSTVRFGNVAGSTGSVVRLFWEQIQKGEPIRVTDPNAERYFMSIPEAVHLILRAATLGKGGETFVFDMGEPVNIHELARTMILFAGLRPGADVPIEFIGLREGEKVTEELWEKWEHPVTTESNRVLVIREVNHRTRGILANIRDMEMLLTREDCDGLLNYLHRLFPDFRPGTRQAQIPRVRRPQLVRRPAAASAGAL